MQSVIYLTILGFIGPIRSMIENINQPYYWYDRVKPREPPLAHRLVSTAKREMKRESLKRFNVVNIKRAQMVTRFCNKVHYK